MCDPSYSLNYPNHGGKMLKKTYKNISLCKFNEEENSTIPGIDVVREGLKLGFTSNGQEIVLNEKGKVLHQFVIKDFTISPLARLYLAFQLNNTSIDSIEFDTFLLYFKNFEERNEFNSILISIQKSNSNGLKNGGLNGASTALNPFSTSEFDSRTEASSAKQYFEFYGFLSQQQNMLQDMARTGTYHRAIVDNSVDFTDKVVLDVGAGTGILSFFAVQAGAKKVYAVEASSMAVNCQELVKANNLLEKIEVIAGKVEDVRIPEHVDMIISEPMGYMLLNERMLESYVHARRFLKEGGKMFPTKADLHFALFSDEVLYQEQINRCVFWGTESFYGVNLTSLRSHAANEIFSQPIVDNWNPEILVSRSVKWTFDFEKDPVEKLHNIVVPFNLEILRPCLLHGIASWFDVLFDGTGRKVWLSTAPHEPPTHWYQIRCLLTVPVFVKSGTLVNGQLSLTANEKQSYYAVLELEIDGIKHSSKLLDLKIPYFRYGGPVSLVIPGQNYESPSDNLLQEKQQQQQFYFEGTNKEDAMSLENIPIPN